MRTLAILPVKSFSRAKQRLSASVDPLRRQRLVEAMLGDVLDAIMQANGIEQILVVTTGERARRIARARGARTLADREQGHNAAAELGIRAALAAGSERALLVPGDCPALDPGELDALLGRPAASSSVIVVPDRHGTGTNALLLTPPNALRPAFGPGSCGRHLTRARAAGIEAQVVEVPSLALDIDTPEDLEALAGLEPRAARTQQLLSRC
jgi:2-phospho-L-lactate guanylyltransferase